MEDFLLWFYSNHQLIAGIWCGLCVMATMITIMRSDHSTFEQW